MSNDLVPGPFPRTPDEENIEKWLQGLDSKTFADRHAGQQESYYAALTQAKHHGRRLALYRAEEARRFVSAVREEVASDDEAFVKLTYPQARPFDDKGRTVILEHGPAGTEPDEVGYFAGNGTWNHDVAGAWKNARERLEKFNG